MPNKKQTAVKSMVSQEWLEVVKQLRAGKKFTDIKPDRIVTFKNKKRAYYSLNQKNALRKG